MPVIPVASDDWSELAFAVARLCIDPKSFETSAALKDELEGNSIAAVVKVFGVQNVELEQRDFELVHKADPRVLPTVANYQTDIRDAYIAGLVLKTAIRLAYHVPKKASVAQAMKIVSHGLAKGPHPLGKSSMNALWGRFKPVSHLTGAFWFAPKNLLPAARVIDDANEVRRSHPIETVSVKLGKREKRKIVEVVEPALAEISEIFAKSLARHYAVAEKMRQYAENFYAPGQKVRGLSLLDPLTMWTVPPQFKLPRVKLDFGPPLTALELSILSKNK